MIYLLHFTPESECKCQTPVSVEFLHQGVFYYSVLRRSTAITHYDNLFSFACFDADVSNSVSRNKNL